MDADRRRRNVSTYRIAGIAGPCDRISLDRLSGCRGATLRPGLSRGEGADLRTATAGDDRLAQVDGPLQLLDHRSLDGRHPASARFSRLSGQALHGGDFGSLCDAYHELTEAIPRQEQLGSDETCFKNNGKKHWIWCITAAAFSVFHIASTRSREVLEKLVGVEFAGYLNLDYFSANCSFAWNFWVKAQYCWAHLIRDIRFLEKHPDSRTRDWGERLLDRSRRMFSAWHRRDEMTAEGVRRSMLIHRDRFLELVRNPPSTKEAANLAARFAVVEYIDEASSERGWYDLSEDYFRFMFADGIEPTNNHNEQQLRHCVMDRRITQGTRGESGQRYHERMWTAIATCKKQDRNFFIFLQDSITAKLRDCKAPSLLPG
ncbi:MAG: hypothetical protein EHM32_13435 [Spirochaetales bacterium]|nr:MAG: hypothetical protein EHM32_13435 [Spirochaetales bacterium]